ncbi:hypothetical protein IEQ34_001096 [Dendrobium chrysotoxum]|uniref:Uncharacterized protein n=1 Tax=Dendrobium chrysotoxum TaxID=161865 RepID=A0AAV7HPI3_DENCH|nr:hypothetical protein IEQ34_001096 [Dendrobium chrysotoxum]
MSFPPFVIIANLWAISKKECASLHLHLAKEPTTTLKPVTAVDMDTSRLTPLVATHPMVKHIVDVAPFVHASITAQETVDIPNILNGNPMLPPVVGSFDVHRVEINVPCGDVVDLSILVPLGLAELVLVPNNMDVSNKVLIVDINTASSDF